MEFVLFMASVLVAVALAGKNTMAAVCGLAIVQFVFTLLWMTARPLLR